MKLAEQLLQEMASISDLGKNPIAGVSTKCKCKDKELCECDGEVHEEDKSSTTEDKLKSILNAVYDEKQKIVKKIWQDSEKSTRMGYEEDKALGRKVASIISLGARGVSQLMDKIEDPKFSILINQPEKIIKWYKNYKPMGFDGGKDQKIRVLPL